MPEPRDAVTSQVGSKTPPCVGKRWDSSEHHGDGLGCSWIWMGIGCPLNPNGCSWIQVGIHGFRWVSIDWDGIYGWR